MIIYFNSLKMGEFLDFRANYKILYFAGLWPKETSGFFYWSYMIMIVIGFLLYIIGQLLHKFLNEHSKFNIIEFTLIFIFLHGVYKGIQIHIQRKKLKDAINDLETMANTYVKNIDEEKRKIFGTYNKSLRRRTLCYLFVNMMSSLTWVTRNVFKEATDNELARQQIVIPNFRRLVTLDIWYPFVIDNYFKFYAVSIFQIILGFNLGGYIGSSDFFKFGINEFVSAHFDVLSFALEDIKLSSKEEMESKLNECIKYHKHIFKVTEKVEDLISFEGFLQCLCFTITFCFMSFSVITTETLSLELGGMLFYSILLLMQIFFLTRSGDMIFHKSQKISHSVYFSDWTNSSNLYKLGVLMTIIRSQRKLTLMAVHFITLNLETFTSVLNTSFSYVTILREIYS